MRVTGVLSGLVVVLGITMAHAESVDPHAGHVMPAATPAATVQAPVADPHAGHVMPAATPAATVQAPVADPHAGHDMEQGAEGEAVSPMAQHKDKMEGKMMRKQAKLERQMGKLNKIDALLAEMGRRADAIAASATPEERAKLAAQHREGLLRAVALLQDVGDAGKGGGMMGGKGGGHEQHEAVAAAPSEQKAAPAGGHDQHASGDKGGMMGGDKGGMMGGDKGGMMGGDKGGMMGGDKGGMMGGDKGGMMGGDKIHMHQVMERRMAAMLEVMGQMLKQMEAGPMALK